MRTLVYFLVISFINTLLVNVFAQQNKPKEISEAMKREKTNRRFRKSLIDKLNQEKKQIEKLLGVDIYKQFDGQFEKLLEEFDKGFYDNMQKIFEDDTFNPLFQNAKKFEYGFGAIGKWSENDFERIFLINQEFSKDAPLDIKVEKQLIKIKGTIEKKFKRRGPNGDIAQVQKMSVNQEISVPHDVFAEKAKFDQKNNKVRIRFPKKNAPKDKLHEKTNSSLETQEEKDNGLKPLKKRSGDTTI